MSIDITEVVKFLGQPTLAVPSELKRDILKVVTHLLSPQLERKNKKILVRHLKAGRTTSNTYKAILIESMLLELEGKPVSSLRLKKLLSEYRPSLPDGASTLATLNWRRFSGKHASDKRLTSHLDRETFFGLFNNTLAELDRVYKDVIADGERRFSRTGNVIVLTRQMIMPPHAPSVRTLEFAKNLTENHGKNVLIVCSSETTSEPTGPLVPQTVGQFSPQFLDISTVTYDGATLKFLMTGRGTFTEQAVRDTLKVMDDFDPEMILSIGAPNILAEPFSDRAFCFFYMSGHGTPMTRGQYFHTWDEPTEQEWTQMREEGVEDQHLFVSTPGYHKPEQFSSLSRSEFNLPEDAFVYAVIGLRLGDEVDTAFIDVLRKITAETNGYFLFAGRFDGFETAFDAVPDVKERCRFAGMQPDIMAVYEMCDAFLNPDRAGGGSSAAQALQAHLPVLTRPIGDVGFMVKQSPTHKTYEALAEAAVTLAKDEALYADYVAHAIQESDRLSVRNEYLQRILDEFNTFAETREAD